MRKIERFSDDVVGRYDHPPGLRQLSHERGRVAMISVTRVNRGIQCRGIGKGLSAGHKGCGRSPCW
jgi:hypothetical protein